MIIDHQERDRADYFLNDSCQFYAMVFNGNVGVLNSKSAEGNLMRVRPSPPAESLLLKIQGIRTMDPQSIRKGLKKL